MNETLASPNFDFRPTSGVARFLGALEQTFMVAP